MFIKKRMVYNFMRNHKVTFPMITMLNKFELWSIADRDTVCATRDRGRGCRMCDEGAQMVLNNTGRIDERRVG